VVVALVVGGIETLGLIAGRWQLKGAFWEMIGKLDSNFALLGYFIIGIFVASWIVSVAIYRWMRYEEVGFGRPPDALDSARPAGAESTAAPESV